MNNILYEGNKKSFKLFYGDCLKIMDELISKNIKVDAIITDPPYGTTACKWDTVIQFDEMWKRLKLLRKERTPIVLFGSEPFSSALRMSNIKEFKYDWIWEKSMPTGMATAKIMPMKYHEIISIFYKNNFYPIMAERSEIGKQRLKNSGKILNGNQSNGNHVKKGKLSGFYSIYDKEKVNPKSIIKIKSVPNCNGTKLHPTQKPVLLLEYLIKTYTNENDLVLDFTCGSGSTGVACINLNRRFIGIDNGYCEKENSEFYGKPWIDVTKYRIEKAIKEKELKEKKHTNKFLSHKRDVNK